MFGTLRLILALLVMTSHIGIFPGVPKISGLSWFNQGVAAVIGFYILSGYLMKYIFVKKFGNSLKNAKVFYVDRLIRIFPQYYFYLIITVIFLLITKYDPLVFKLSALFSHILVLPLNLNRWIDVNFFPWVTDYALIPPAWTLGTELQFYLLVPLLFTNVKVKYLAFIGSIAFALYAAFGFINTNYYGVRMLPGLIFVFLTGALIYDINSDEDSRKSNQLKLVGLWIGTLLFYSVLRAFGKIDVDYNAPVIVGYLVSVPVVYLLSTVKYRFKFDELFGNLSYGVYLNHFLLIWILNYLQIFTGNSGVERWMRFWLILPISLGLSYLSYWLTDRRLRNVRIGFREQKVQNLEPAPTLAEEPAVSPS